MLQQKRRRLHRIRRRRYLIELRCGAQLPHFRQLLPDIPCPGNDNLLRRRQEHMPGGVDLQILQGLGEGRPRPGQIAPAGDLALPLCRVDDQRLYRQQARDVACPERDRMINAQDQRQGKKQP